MAIVFSEFERVWFLFVEKLEATTWTFGNYIDLNLECLEITEGQQCAIIHLAPGSWRWDHIHILFCIVLCDSFSIYSTPYSKLFGTNGVSISQWPVVRVYITTYMKPVYIHHIKKLIVSCTGMNIFWKANYRMSQNWICRMEMVHSTDKTRFFVTNKEWML